MRVKKNGQKQVLYPLSAQDYDILSNRGVEMKINTNIVKYHHRCTSVIQLNYEKQSVTRNYKFIDGFETNQSRDGNVIPFQVLIEQADVK